MLLRWVVILTVGFSALRRGDAPLLLASQPVNLGGGFLAPVSGSFPAISPPTSFSPIIPLPAITTSSLLAKNGCIRPEKEAAAQEIATNFRDAIQDKSPQGIRTAKQLVTSDFMVLNRFHFSSHSLNLLVYSFYMNNDAIAECVLEQYVKAGIMPNQKALEEEVKVLSPCEQQRVLAGIERTEAARKQLVPAAFYNGSLVKEPKKGHRCYVQPGKDQIICHEFLVQAKLENPNKGNNKKSNFVLPRNGH